MACTGKSTKNSKWIQVQGNSPVMGKQTRYKIYKIQNDQKKNQRPQYSKKFKIEFKDC